MYLPRAYVSAHANRIMLTCHTLHASHCQGEDLMLQLQQEREERERAGQKVAALEAQAKRLAESLADAQRQAEAQAKQAETDKAAAMRQVMAREAEADEERRRAAALQVGGWAGWCACCGLEDTVKQGRGTDLEA